MKSVRLIVCGRVQGVFFRQNVKNEAVRLGLCGFVKNHANGDVEIIAEGDESKINELIKFCKNSPGHSHVENVDMDFEKVTGEFDGFEVRR